MWRSETRSPPRPSTCAASVRCFVCMQGLGFDVEVRDALAAKAEHLCRIGARLPHADTTNTTRS